MTLIKIGKIVNTHGIKGELRLLSKFPYKDKVFINNKEYCIYVTTNSTRWEGRLGYENDGVYCGEGLLENTWAFKERGQAEHFVKFFYKELILLSLADEHKVTFI